MLHEESQLQNSVRKNVIICAENLEKELAYK